MTHVPPSPRRPLKTALIYDFDGTLARGNMQEVSFIPSVGMGIGDFWNEAERLTQAADGDGIAYGLGVLGRENNPLANGGDKGYRYVKLSGAAPTRAA